MAFQYVYLLESLFATAVVHPSRSCHFAKATAVAGVVAAAGIAHAPTVVVGVVAEPADPIPAPAVGTIAGVVVEVADPNRVVVLAALELAGPIPVVAETVVEAKGASAVPIPAAGAVIAGPMSVAQVVEIEEAVDPTAGIDPIAAVAVVVAVVAVAPNHFA